MKTRVVLFLLMAWLSLAGCSNKPPAVSMRVGVAETLDALPLNISYQAQAFQVQNIDLRISTFRNTQEISSATRRGELDAAIVDLSSALLLASEDTARILRVALQATPERAMYVVITRRDAIVTTLAQLGGKKLAVAADLGDRFAADHFLEAAGLDPASVNRIQVPDASAGVDLLRQGEVDAAIVPEVMTWGPLSRETRALTAPTKSQVGETVVVASRKFIEQQPEGLKRFMVAYEAGVRAILWDPEPYRFNLVKSSVPKELVNDFALPVYPLAQLPIESEIEQANAWLIKQGMLAAPVPFKSAATGAFLPDPSLVELAIFCHRP